MSVQFDEAQRRSRSIAAAANFEEIDMSALRFGLAAVLAASLAMPLAAQTGTQPQGPSAQQGETSDRTPEKKTPTPLEQTDRVGTGSSAAGGTGTGAAGASATTPSGPPAQPGETSDRTPRKHPGASGEPAEQK